MKSFDESLKIQKKYNKQIFHIEHGITVALFLSYFAKEYGLDENEVEYWKLVGLLHDIDFELYPSEHCKKCIIILKQEGFEEDFINSICSHGYGICSQVEPKQYMEKVLYTVDELTGIFFAASKLRPSKSCKDMELNSLKKKFKDKRFAAGCDRNVIINGAEKYLTMNIDELLEKTLNAMKENEDKIKQYIDNFNNY